MKKLVLMFVILLSLSINAQDWSFSSGLGFVNKSQTYCKFPEFYNSGVSAISKADTNFSGLNLNWMADVPNQAVPDTVQIHVNVNANWGGGVKYLLIDLAVEDSIGDYGFVLMGTIKENTDTVLSAGMDVLKPIIRLNRLYLVYTFATDSPAQSVAGVVLLKNINVDLGITGITDMSQTIKGFELYQNYPNPFNPSTKISFSLPASEKVSLKVYDILGRQVSTLIDNQYMSEGNHTIPFDGANLASGMYIYRIEAGKYTKTKKMLLVK